MDGVPAEDRRRERAVMHELGPVNEEPGDALWHRGNGGEAIPGVSTPLNADYWRASMEVALLATFRRLGAITRAERGAPDGAGSPYAGQVCRFFFGRLASDFDIVCTLYGRLPGVDPNVIEEQMLGRARHLERAPTTHIRRLIAAIRTAWTVIMLPGVVRRRARKTNAWWHASIAELAADPSYALAIFDDARARMRHDLGVQVAVGSLQPGFVEQLRRTAGTNGIDDTTIDALLSGVSGIAEARMMADLWAAAHGERTLEEFVARYGYYAPDEGELSTRSWREDPGALTGIIDAYRALREEEGPIARLRARAAAYDDARRRALHAVSGLSRLRLRVVLGLARRYTELREEGKVLMLQCLDVARAAARVGGAALARQSTIDDPDDVFFLTRDELATTLPTPSDLRMQVAERRAQHARYEALVLPLSFTAAELRRIVDEQVEEPRQLAADAVVEGLGVSPGEATGIARVIVDPLECRDFMPGEILVCPTTDPGWAPLLSLAGGVVLDMGSMLSHGAIVARELGVPCVANTTDGTRRIITGALVRVDGTNGIVETLEAPEHARAEVRR